MAAHPQMAGETKPAPELLLAQLILSAILVGLLGHATYEMEYTVPRFSVLSHNGKTHFRGEELVSISVQKFRCSYPVLFLLNLSAAYFCSNLLLYVTMKLLTEPLLQRTRLVLVHDVVFSCLMLVGSIGAIANPGERALDHRESEIFIASGISMFCCVSSSVGVYYSYRVYKGL